MARTCVFCGGTPCTNEHVLPRWLQTSFPDLKQAAALHVRETQTTRSARTGTLLDVKAKVVCASCNYGWMNDLESGVRPFLPQMITGRDLTLPKAKQSVLATWSVKTILMFQHAHRQQDQTAIPREDYIALFRERQPSDIMQALVAYAPPPTNLPENIDLYAEFICIPMSATVRIEDAENVHSLASDSYVATLRIGNFVTQLIRIGLRDLSLKVTPSPDLSRLVVPLWPTGGRPQWPPLPLNRIGGFTRFANLLVDPI